MSLIKLLISCLLLPQGARVATRKEFNEFLETKVQDAITTRLQKGLG